MQSIRGQNNLRPVGPIGPASGSHGALSRFAVVLAFFVRVHGMDHYVGPTQKNSKSSVRFTYSTPDKNKILSAAILPYYSLGLCLDSNFFSSNF